MLVVKEKEGERFLRLSPVGLSPFYGIEIRATLSFSLWLLAQAPASAL